MSSVFDPRASLLCQASDHHAALGIVTAGSMRPSSFASDQISIGTTSCRDCRFKLTSSGDFMPITTCNKQQIPIQGNIRPRIQGGL